MGTTKREGYTYTSADTRLHYCNTKPRSQVLVEPGYKAPTIAQELQYSELEDVSPHMWELIAQVIVPTQVLAFTVSWVGVQYTLEIVQYTLMPRQ